MKKLNIIILLIGCAVQVHAQLIPLDTTYWEVNAQAHVFETFDGQASVYLQGGSITLKDTDFLNGTIEYDIYLKEDQAFPGALFRADYASAKAEEFYIRPHQSGNPDANQVAPLMQGITAWQLYYGERYSFPYAYRFDDWTHVKILVNGSRAQLFLDHAKQPNLSWNLFHEPKPGKVLLRGGNLSGMHIANVSVSTETPELSNFSPGDREPLEGVFSSWEISDKFEETRLDNVDELDKLISERTWQGSAVLQEGVAADISRVQRLNDGKPGNTVFARITLPSDQNVLRLLEFGYSDRVVVILNGVPLYRGNNGWRTRDYRYLGTIGLFDAVYLPLKKGENTLLMAVSEDFGGWLITARFADAAGLLAKE